MSAGVGTGIIIPPPEIQNIIQKTAKIVAQKGAELEEMIKQNLIDKPSFSFLKYNDPYRPYFDQKVQEYKNSGVDGFEDGDENGEQVAKVEKKQARPPPEIKFVYDCGSIPILDNDIIQHTAQFVAKNGQKFLIALTEREKNNPQFDFLKPTHSIFPYFTSLIDSYSRIIEFNEKEGETLLAYIADRKAVLKACTDIYEYEAEMQHSRRRKEELEEEERAQRAMIDWNDFVVVETIDFKEGEALTVPVDVSAREKLLQMDFTKANVNPDFAFMIDASQAYAAITSKAQTDKKKTAAQPSAPVPTQQERQAIQPPVQQISQIQERVSGPSSDEISINLKVQNSPEFGTFAGKSLSMDVKETFMIGQIIMGLSKQLGFQPGCSLRSAERPMLMPTEVLRDIGAYNGMVLEFFRPNS